ncbi:hypothetical protein J4226_01190 [Candidatus Pacearchaeota archaeon]|nr:hypothetical protein [Candidatus Pacearchaeota archaeon]
MANKKQRIEVEEFKKEWRNLHQGFPRYLYSDRLEQVVPTQEVRDNLIKHGFLLKCIPTQDKNGTKHPYMLGPNSLSLISSWNTEDLSKRTLQLSKDTKFLTKVVIFLSFLSIAVSGVAIYLGLR